MAHAYEVTVSADHGKRIMVTNVASDQQAGECAVEIARNQMAANPPATPIEATGIRKVPLGNDDSPIGELRTMIWTNPSNPELRLRCVIMATPKPHGDTFADETPIDVVLVNTGEIYPALSCELSAL
ncbi:hypothetical protein AWH63_10855 [Marinobacter sp. C18]|uniref:hypothetical protein n=1 Tax=Marinobacter sp. C18 TaxID=1772288 RepID=UPI000948D36F|nr:hypothetical protein [Marinobacter sp. C18]OLF82030.1 hypothetical protein AWH63_10855 [Marinobacter sp. C18]